MRGTGRLWCGHCYINEGDGSKPNGFLSRLEQSSCIRKAKFSSEKGGENGMLHYQFSLATDSVRGSQIRRELNMVKGEWLEKTHNKFAQDNYVAKEDTHIAGPWDWESGKLWNPAWDDFHPRGASERKGQGDTIDIMLEDKMREIKMWSDFLNNHVSENCKCYSCHMLAKR